MLKQFSALAMISLRSLPQRLGNAGVVVISSAGVVAVLVSVLAMAAGFRHTLAANGRDDRVIALRAGSESEIGSAFLRADLDAVAALPGVAHDVDGKAAVSGEVVTVVGLPLRDGSGEGNAVLRGVGPTFQAVRPEFHVVEGRLFRPAVREVVVGRAAAAQYSGLTPGHVLHLRNADWTIVGLFETGGDVHESELFADADTVASAIGRPGYTSAVAMLEPRSGFPAFAAAMAADGRLKLEPHRESDYMRAQSRGVETTISVVGRVVGIIMALGASFAALNSMYSALDDRRREIATLRAIGFQPTAVLAAVLVEALLLAVAGGALGATIAWLGFDGHRLSTMGSAYAQVMFPLRVSLPLAITGVAWSCVIGLLGGLFPALGAARQSVVEGLRAT